ncbi:MAG: UPF0262 family protein [Alphaproteobacteria bacterium]|nr:UPF0262 family protein [Alphaproteobacteria bacterium]
MSAPKDGPDKAAARSPNRIVKITLDEKSVVRRAPEIEHERAVAIFDLIEDNSFAPTGDLEGPFALHLSVADNRLVMDIKRENDQPLTRVVLPLSPFRRIVKDYFQVCESYFQAIRSAPASRIEAIDMGRRGLHNEGSDLLRQRLKDKVEIDNDTARRLFTLVCVLHIRG